MSATDGLAEEGSSMGQVTCKRRWHDLGRRVSPSLPALVLAGLGSALPTTSANALAATGDAPIRVCGAARTPESGEDGSRLHIGPTQRWGNSRKQGKGMARSGSVSTGLVIAPPLHVPDPAPTTIPFTLAAVAVPVCADAGRERVSCGGGWLPGMR